MDIYAKYGYKDFIVALGYKADYVKEFFYNYRKYFSDLDIDFSKDKITFLNKNSIDYKVKLIDTGIKTMTGGRLSKIKKYIDSDNFFLTYGDGLSDVNLKKLLNFHVKNKGIATVTTVRPSSRFGHLSLKNNLISSFREKSKLDSGWINGGFFVFNKKFFDFLEDNNENLVLEKEPLGKLSKKNKFFAYKHNSFWECIDTKRDLDYVTNVYNKNGPIWLK